MIDLLTSLITLIAIAGGGGSSGGGGGGGGSSGGGGGSFSSGSSSSGGSGDGSSDPWSIFIVIAIFLVVYFVIWRAAAAGAKEIKRRREEKRIALLALAAKDKVWEPGSLVNLARDTFLRYQKDWSVFNLDSMKTYMTPRYYQYNLLMMGALKLASRQNDVQSPKVYDAEVMNFSDDIDNKKDWFTAKMVVNVHDVLRDTDSKEQLFAQNLNATEFYRFKREKSKWLFDGIDQATANPMMHSEMLEAFANENSYFYSLDWGHLLLPARGQLFQKGSFGISDINNHIVGLYKDIIIQLYTYVPTPNQATKSYLIAQTSVPKSYGNIVVRRKKGLFPGSIKNLRKLKTEWGDFNSKYEVFASDEELATSFELLNPKYMEQLQALSFEINIEVVDNMIYLYTQELGIVNPDHYETMLEVLKAAFKEMRL